MSKKLTWGKSYTPTSRVQPFAYKVGKPFQYKSGRREQKIDEDSEKQEYFVRGERASKPEYFAAGALDFMEQNGEIEKWVWQPSYITFQNVPGEIRLDIMVHIPPMLPIFIDGRWHFKSAGQRADDKIQDARLNDRLKKDGALPVVRIPAEPYLVDEETALQTMRMAIQGEQFGAS